MSLFSRLEERMRPRDSQEDSQEKEKSAAPSEKGGLFGSIQLKPAQGEPSVPPPAATGLVVPSLEEARAELDRIRAQSARGQDNENNSSSGLFRRDKTGQSEDASQAPRADAATLPSRETVTFGAVSLPPRADEFPADAPEFAPFEPEPAMVSPQSVLAETVEDERESEKTFHVPSVSQFTDTNETPATNAFLDAPPAAATSPASDVETNVESDVEQTVYAPTPLEEREIVARAEPQIVAPQDIGPAIEASRSAAIETPATEVAAFPESAAPSAAPIEEPLAPAPSPSNTPGMTPFQRLMAARAAQNGPPISRPRNERPLMRSAPELIAPIVEAPVAEAPIVEAPIVEAPIVEAPIVEAPIVEAPIVEALESENTASFVDSPALQDAIEQAVESPVARAAQIEVPAVELPAATAPQIDEPQIDEPQIDVPPPATDSMPVAAVAESLAPAEDEDIDMETPAANQAGAEEAPLVQSRVSSADEEMPLADESFAGDPPVDQAPIVEVAAPMPTTESEPEMDATASKAEAMIAQSRENGVATSSAPETPAPEAAQQEAEIVPERDSTANASPDAESPSAMPNSETVEPPARPALSLAERLARTPRAELDAAHAEAEALAPEILENSPFKRDVSAPARSAAPMSFAERLAARNKPRIEEPPAPAPPIPPTSTEPSFVAPTPQSAKQDLDETPVAFSPAPDFAPTPEPRSSEPRSFSERLAARTGLDRHLQVPAPESAPAPQDLATHNTELARINEGAELSEREMKNRVLFRQKHLVFDHVLGSLDQRTLQNPTREAVKPQVEKGVDSALRELGLKLEQSERNWLVDEFVREVADLGALVPMLEDPSVSKIVVTGAKDVSVERLGRIERTGVSFRDDDHLMSLVRRIAEMSGGRVDAKVPLLDRPLPDGGRIRAKVPPLAPQPTLTIEKSTGNPFVVLKRQMDEKSRGDSLPYAQLRERIQQRLLREFEGDAAALAGDQDKLRQQVEEMIGNVVAEEHVAVTRAERASLVMDLLNEIVGLGPIEPLLNDPDVDEVMVNGPYQIYVERKGKLELTSQRFRDNGHVMQVIDRIVAPLGRRVDEKSPMVDGRLRDGSRFNAIIPPLALSGPTMTIRKFARDPFTMSDLINFGTITREAAQFLQAAVEGRLNIVVSGGTGSGKTTTLNVLSSFIPSTERIVTIEDAAELQMRQEHVIRMETRPPNIEGVGEVSIRDLVKNSLRMRPDRIVVGECRGGEALDMLQAMNTGHDGSLTTAHSNGPRDTCKRLETMVMMAGFDLPVRAIREQISMAVQLVVHQERMRDGKRRVTAVTEIVGMEGDVLTMQDIFRFEQEGMDDDGRIIGSLQATGMRPKYYETIVDNGGTISMDIFTPKAQEAAPRARINERGGR